jgi:hypothetical protein
VLGLVRREAEEDLGDDVVDQRAWRRRRHTGALWFWVGIEEESDLFFFFLREAEVNFRKLQGFVFIPCAGLKEPS